MAALKPKVGACLVAHRRYERFVIWNGGTVAGCAKCGDPDVGVHTPACIKLGVDFDDHEWTLRLARFMTWRPSGLPHCQACADGEARPFSHSVACKKIQEKFNAADKALGFVMPRDISTRGRKDSSAASA